MCPETENSELDMADFGKRAPGQGLDLHRFQYSMKA